MSKDEPSHVAFLLSAVPEELALAYSSPPFVDTIGHKPGGKAISTTVMAAAALKGEKEDISELTTEDLPRQGNEEYVPRSCTDQPV